MTLLWLAPNVPSCEECQSWLYDDSWKKVERPKGKPMRRPAGAPTPCHSCHKSVDGRPNPGAELSDKNRRAYQYYRECLVDDTGILPRDRLVVRNNALIKTVEESLTIRLQEPQKKKR